MRSTHSAMNNNSNDLNVSRALNRKKISHKYHTNMPAFLRSEGPFSVYDHSLRYQPKEPETVTDKATMQAVKRYENDLDQLQSQRQKEKTDFYARMTEFDAKNEATKMAKLSTLRLNQQFVSTQMQERREQKLQEHARDTQYYKPHYGPEDTQQSVEKSQIESRQKVDQNFQAFKGQIQDRVDEMR